MAAVVVPFMVAGVVQLMVDDPPVAVLTANPGPIENPGPIVSDMLSPFCSC